MRRGKRLSETQTFGTTTGELLRLSDWLAEGGCTHIGLESTGEFWKPVFHLLASTFEVWLLNAAHIKAVPGRTTDVKDAQWIAELCGTAYCGRVLSPTVPSASCVS